MFSQDYVRAAGPADNIPLNPGGTLAAATGFRIIPVLAFPSTGAQMQAAYAALKVRVTKQTVNFLTGVTEDHFISGPDWIRSPGMGKLEIIGGAAGTYRIWVATDCKEMQDAVIPSMYGFPTGDSNAATTGTLTATNQTQNFTAAAPTVVGDGADLTGARAVKVSVRPATAAAVLTAIGVLKAYSWSTNLVRWIRVPELDFNIIESVTEPMPIGTGSLTVPIGIGRIQWTPSALAASAGTQVVTSIEVLT